MNTKFLPDHNTCMLQKVKSSFSSLRPVIIISYSQADIMVEGSMQWKAHFILIILYFTAAVRYRVDIDHSSQGIVYCVHYTYEY